MNYQLLELCLAAFALGALGMYIANRKVQASSSRQRWIKFTTYFFVTTTVMLLARLGPTVFSYFVLILLLVGAYELYSVLTFTKVPFAAVIWAGYALCGVGMMLFSRLAAPEQAMFVYLIVAVFDGFSQVCGQLLGKRQLAKTISPSKTMEGALGGALVAAVTAILLRQLVGVNSVRALVTCGAIVAAALAGDLAASWVKRKCGVKDFGHLLPGHGGVLDRFDSFLFAAPISLLLLR